jgi:hypothetical protein
MGINTCNHTRSALQGWQTYTGTYQVEVEVTLRPTVSRPVHLGVLAILGQMTSVTFPSFYM